MTPATSPAVAAPDRKPPPPRRVRGFSTLRLRLVGLSSLILLCMSLFHALFYPSRLSKLQHRHLEERIRSLATSTAASVAAAVEFDDARSAQETLSGLIHVADFAYAIVLRENGTALASVGAGAPSQPRGAGGGATWLGTEGEIRRIDQKVQGRGGGSGTLILGLSLRSLIAETRAETRLDLWVAVVVFLLGCVGTFVIGTILVGPVHLMTDLALRIADGDLSQKNLDIERSDEVGQMAAAFDKMLNLLRSLASIADRLGRGDLSGQIELQGHVGEAFRSMLAAQRDVVRQIAEVAISLGAESTQIQGLMQMQEESANRKVKAVTEVARTMESLLDSAQHIAQSAHGVFDNAERSRQTTDGMSAHVEKLNFHTTRIAELLELIRDIADRSDLLALNASLEATRAGEAGRAFSLVASEMRRLAERVTASVADVKSLLVDIRTSAEQTATATGDSRRLAESTTESARRISTVTEQQRTATSQVLDSMTEISALVSSGLTSTRDVRSSSAHLHSAAERLNQLVRHFKT
jgi:methyl-accepting chemotaxis protein